jgi:hypothetical protein
MPAQGNIGLADSLRSGFSRQNLIAEAQRRGLTLPQTNQPTLQPSEAIEPQQPVRAPAIGRSQQDLIAEAQRRGLTLPKGVAPATPAPAPDVSTPGGLGTFLQTTIANVPGSAADVATGVMSLFTPDGLRQLGDVAGRTAFGGLDVLLGKESEDAKVAKAVFKESTRLFRDPLGTIQSDPVGALLDVAGILSGGAGALAGRGGTLGKIGAKAAQIEAKINPITVVGTKGAKVAKKAGSKLLETAKARAAIASGVGSESVDIFYEAGKAGGAKAAAVRDAMARGDVVLEDQAGKIITGIADAENAKQLNHRANIATLALKEGQQIDINAVRSKILRDIEAEWNIKFDLVEKVPASSNLPIEVEVVGMPGGPGLKIDFREGRLHLEGEQKRVSKMAKEMMKWRDNGIMKSYDFEQALDQFMESGIDTEKFSRSNSILTGARDVVSKEMKKKVDGFAEMQDEFSMMSQFLDDSRAILGVPKGTSVRELLVGGDKVTAGISENTLTKVGNLLNDRTSKNLVKRRKAVEVIENMIERRELERLGIPGIERMTPQQSKKLALENDVSSNIFEALAGLRGSGTTQMGFGRGRDNLLGGMLGGTIGASFGVMGVPVGIAMGKWIGNMTINNPRAVGRLFMGLGARTADIAPFVRRLQNVVDKLPAEKLKRGLTIGTAVQMARERAPQDPDVRDLFEKLRLQ